jgi:hypothetical protein
MHSSPYFITSLCPAAVQQLKPSYIDTDTQAFKKSGMKGIYLSLYNECMFKGHEKLVLRKKC